jgi:hypothetical protein
MESKLKNAVFTQEMIDQIRALKCYALGDFGITQYSTTADISCTAHTSDTVVAYVIDGNYYTTGCATSPAQIDATTCVVQAAGTRCRYLASIDKAGVVTVTKGTEVASVTTGAITTVSVTAADKKYNSTAASFLSFKVGMQVNITGFTSHENNGVFFIEAVDPAGKWIQVRQGRQIDEAAGDSVTIIRESELPDLPIAQAPISSIIVTTTNATFTMGTTSLSGMASFVKLCAMPTGLIQ